MALLCTFPLFDSKLLPMAYSLTFNLLALLCTPPLGGKTSCCLLPVFCLLFRFVLQGLIIKTKFFLTFVLWKMSEWNEFSFLVNGRRARVLPPPEWQTTQPDSAHLPLLLAVWIPFEQKQMPAACLLISAEATGSNTDRAGPPRGWWEASSFWGSESRLSPGARLWGMRTGNPIHVRSENSALIGLFSCGPRCVLCC